jgi:hypothetical protein
MCLNVTSAFSLCVEKGREEKGQNFIVFASDLGAILLEAFQDLLWSELCDSPGQGIQSANAKYTSIGNKQMDVNT